jgi:hypothetical protein
MKTTTGLPLARGLQKTVQMQEIHIMEQDLDQNSLMLYL